MYLHVQFPTNPVKSTINIDGSFTIHSYNTYINTLKKKNYTLFVIMSAIRLGMMKTMNL